MSDIQEPLPWGKSSATVAVLEKLVADRLLPRNSDSGAPAWISPHRDETELKPPSAGSRGICVSTTILAAQLQPQLHLAGGGLRCRLRGIPWDRGTLGSLDPPVPR